MQSSVVSVFIMFLLSILSFIFYMVIKRGESEVDREIRLYNSHSDIAHDAKVVGVHAKDTVRYYLDIYTSDSSMKGISVEYSGVPIYEIDDVVSVKYFKERSGLIKAVIIDDDSVQFTSSEGLAKWFLVCSVLTFITGILAVLRLV